DDLQVAVFLQDDETKAIFQAAYATLTGAFISLTPENNATEVLIDQPLLIQFSEAVRMIGGDAITSDNIATFITLEQVGDKGTPVVFTAEIDNSNTLITLTPTEDLLMSTDYLLTVAPVENMNGRETYEAMSAFKTQTNVGILLPAKQNMVIYPNPARDLITVKYNESIGNSVSLKVYGTSGSEMSVTRLGADKGTFSIGVSALPAGVYFLQLTGSEKSATTRFVILK
ncbi:MAG: T9SS type A sorting domain-containing protein, partial [Lentimicrobium sp.]|nr:T9SS type A sorting domain-containing protein [Lentimicrobium sp.]